MHICNDLLESLFVQCVQSCPFKEQSVTSRSNFHLFKQTYIYFYKNEGFFQFLKKRQDSKVSFINQQMFLGFLLWLDIHTYSKITHSDSLVKLIFHFS